MQIDRGARFCSFCGKSQDESPGLLGAGTGCYICVACVYLALGEIESENMRAMTHTDDTVEIRGQRRCEACGGPGPCLWADEGAHAQQYCCVKCHPCPFDPFFARKQP